MTAKTVKKQYELQFKRTAKDQWHPCGLFGNRDYAIDEAKRFVDELGYFRARVIESEVIIADTEIFSKTKG